MGQHWHWGLQVFGVCSACGDCPRAGVVGRLPCALVRDLELICGWWEGLVGGDLEAFSSVFAPRALPWYFRRILGPSSNLQEEATLLPEATAWDPAHPCLLSPGPCEASIPWSEPQVLPWLPENDKHSDPARPVKVVFLK